MNTLLLQPNDVLFFRDGRPMSGGLAGHGAAWPLPTVTNAALHAALHRAGLTGVHGHDHIDKQANRAKKDARKFGSLLTAGPFPVRVSSSPARQSAVANASTEWFFPRPADLAIGETNGQPDPDFSIVLKPLAVAAASGHTSLPTPARFGVASSRPPAKEKDPPAWLEADAFAKYLAAGDQARVPANRLLPDKAIFLPEATVGIGMDAATGAQDGERIYSAHYLRLRDAPEAWRLGLLAACEDKQGAGGKEAVDLLASLFQQEQHIVVGGQQRVCTVAGPTATPAIPLPRGRMTFAPDADGRCRVKWVLLTPAIWPEMTPGNSKRGRVNEHDPGMPRQAQLHPGGWLPNWICPLTGEVLLEPISEAERKRRRRLNYAGRGYDSHPPRIARLVAALVPKPLAVTGYFLPHEAAERNGGPKPIHLAVPAGAIYYFETSGAAEAAKLVAALNWHGPTDDCGQPVLSRIKNRRSTLFGEKGFGLGVCGTWSPVSSSPSTSIC